MDWHEDSADRGKHAIMFYPGSFIDRADGSQVRTCGLLDWLCANFARVTIYTYNKPVTRKWTAERRLALAEAYPAVELLIEEESRLLVWLARLKKLGLLLFPGHGKRILRLRVKGLTPQFERLLAGANPLLCVNYMDNLTHLNGIEPSHCMVETHDISFLRRAKGLLRSPISVLSLARLRTEFGALGSVAAAVGITRNETYLLRNLAPTTRAFYVPDYSPRPTIGGGGAAHRWDLLFVGSGNIINERGLLELLEARDLGLERYSIAICGSVCQLPSIKARAEALSNVELLGFVDDLAPVYAATKACLSPTNGTGLNIKIVEALRHGKPIFATRSAMDGLTAGCRSCVFPLDSAHFTALLNNPQSLQAASRAASDYYVQFTTDGDLSDLARFVRRLDLPCSERLAPQVHGRHAA